MAIPKIIHYCWYGGNPLPEKYRSYINICAKKMPSYKIVIHNEDDAIFSDEINKSTFLYRMYSEKKYAFVSDYMRLVILYKYGGFYLDTDVEVIKPFDDLLKENFVLGYIFDCLIGTAFIGSSKENVNLLELLRMYNEASVVNGPNNHIFTDFLLNKSDFILNGKTQRTQDIIIYEKGYFEQPTFRKYGYTIHHADSSWHNKKYNIVRICIKKILGETLYKKITAVYSFRINTYRKYYVK